MDLVTKAEFARRHGVSKPAVQKWQAQGYLIMSDGKVDVAATDAKLRDARKGRFRSAASQVNPGVNRAVDASTPSVEDAAATIAAFLQRLLDGEYETEAEADRVKANALAGLRALEFQEKAGSLVNLEMAERTLIDTSRAARDAWLNWPSRVGPLAAAELGVEADKATEVLTAHVHKHLEDLAKTGADAEGQS
ncbi:hypothetical protein [Roseospira visakhapatnamensis]|uniref:Terminase small subunit n=1 Tax=Roseospira visakhapatnamensis TaxID=390880 RepID=A0A7W6RG55_9PROT|nr:hypothetical protein [Roseospira visakhapatnamensis]MBB4267720.1 hypothetical protein [Roseospira visakhapatnamensis]